MPGPVPDLIELVWEGTWVLGLFTRTTGDPIGHPGLRTMGDIAKIKLSTRWRQSTSP